MPFISATARQATASSGGTSGYLKIKKDKEGDSIRFCILSPEPLEYWTAWGTDKESGKSRPFRFVAQPTNADIDAELGPNYERAKQWQSEEVRPAAFAMSFFVWDYESESVMVFELDKKTLIRELDNISQQEDYTNLHEWDLVITWKGPNNGWYSIMPAPRKKGQQEKIDEAWSAAQAKGFDINKLIVGESPFGES